MVRAVLLILAMLPLAAQRLPRFEDYPVKVYTGKTVPPKPPKPQDLEVRCCFWAEDAGPINFAGKYRLVEDTCGSECLTVDIVDRAIGDHFQGGGYSYSYIFGSNRRPDLPHGLEYRSTSRLLIVHGCPGEVKCGTYYLLMNPGGLKRLKYVSFGFDEYSRPN
jgi:hypothetical protein